MISNGHGEDAIAAAIGRELLNLGYQLAAVPLVGEGRAYREAGIPVFGPLRSMPSGGFVHLNPLVFARDLAGGWLTMSLQHYRVVRELAQTSSATLVVGDIYGLLVGTIFGRCPLFHMQPLVSAYYREGLAWYQEPWRATVNGYVAPERALMRLARRVYPRDTQSLALLQKAGLAQAVYLGNPMMDAVAGEAPIPLGPPWLLLLPGSRADAYFALPIMLAAADLLEYSVLVSWPRGLDRAALELPGWRQEGENPVWLEGASGKRIAMVEGGFKSALQGAKLAIATAGTATEQAAGLGIPAVAFATHGPQYTPEFAQAQARLLGPALRLVPAQPDQIAAAVRQLWQDPSLYAQAQAAGRERIGPAGGALRIAQDMSNYLQ